jgi:hypothetical protein
MNKSMTMLAALAALGVSAVPANSLAQQRACGPRADLVAHLADKYREAPIAIARTDDGQVIEVFASPQGETWSVVVTTAIGVSCLVVSGQDWQAIPRVAELGRSA